MKIGIGGIKFSEELVHVSHCAPESDDQTFFAGLVKHLADNRINIPFLCSGIHGDEVLSTFCIAATDFTSLANTFEIQSPPGRETVPRSLHDLLSSGRLKIKENVGTITLYPHRRSMAFLGRVVSALGESGIVIHSLCTSISALAINIDYNLLDFAAEVLEKIVDLPDDHAPFRADFCVRQVVSP